MIDIIDIDHATKHEKYLKYNINWLAWERVLDFDVVYFYFSLG